jgi:UDP-N-acetylglucosamine acyltransferase
MAIHPTAVVDPRAELDPTCDVGPYAVIDGPVRIGPRSRVLAHAFLTGNTILGADNVVHPGATIGGEPQDWSWKGTPSGVRIGDRNLLREHCEIHRATTEGGWTEIGDDNFVMSQAHVGHDCRLGNGIVLATGATLAGHVSVGDRVFISGNCVVHQYTRIGRLALMRGLSRASRDIPPFVIVDYTHMARALNVVGLRRAGFDRATIHALRRAFRILFRSRTNLTAALGRVETEVRSPEVAEMIAFIRSAKRGVARGGRAGVGDTGGAADED